MYIEFVSCACPINWPCRSDIEIFFDWAMSFFRWFEKTICKMDQTGLTEFKLDKSGE